MKFISHRGNLYCSDKARENKPDYIVEAWLSGFDVEIDVWYYNQHFWLGHDHPETLTEPEFLQNPNFWIHAKTLETCQKLLEIRNIHCFYHQNDEGTLTSNNYIWTFPGKSLYLYSVAVIMPGDILPGLNICAGICADDIALIKQDYEQQI